MGFKKFNQLAGGEYWENYFGMNESFYSLIKDHMVESIQKTTQGTAKPIGIDLGAGPGVAAMLAFEANIKSTIFGYEPSDTHEDGVRLAAELTDSNDLNCYCPINEGIEKFIVDDYKCVPISFITALRSCHEMADSVGSKDRFFQLLSKVTSLLVGGAPLIVGEPQYTEEITSNPEDYSDLIWEVQQYQMEVIKHCHVPLDYFTNGDMKLRMKGLGLELVREDISENNEVLEGLQRRGLDLQESPCLFYVQTYRK